jgi:two-component system, NarL family, nitrate/nitrite response regulator NarL
MSWTQRVENDGSNRLPVAICETQPLLIEGLRACLAASGVFTLANWTQSLEDAARTAITTSPRIVVLDKAFGGPPLIEWLSRMSEICRGTAVIIWGNSMTESEALRYLKLGAKGIMKKTADAGTVLACLENVADGFTWMEDSLFREAAPTDRKARLDLTPREQQVLELVEQGLRNKEIARELGIRPGTVKIHLKHIFEKTGVRGRYGLALSGLRDKATPQLLTV